MLEHNAIEILYEEGPCLVVCKPPGVATQAPPGIDSLETRIKLYLKQRDGSPHDVYLGVPHRLDRPASGAIVFATRRRAAQKLAKQFEHREIKKTYWAWVEGQPDPPEGTWRDSVRKIYGKPQAEIVAADHPDARLAVLHYRVVRTGSFFSSTTQLNGHDSIQEAGAVAVPASLLEIDLETGRTHQVRIQTASRNHPVLGDRLYGSKVPFGPSQDDERLRAIALHARTLAFRHPTSKEWVSITAPMPAFWPEEPQ